MDTVHDLGGVQGFGSIPNTAEDDSKLFAEEWKARVWALAMIMMARLREDQTGWTLDWYRHVLERLPPDLYLRADYFEKWILAEIVTVIDEGVIGPEEIFKARAQEGSFAYRDPEAVSEVPAASGRFKPGDRVVAKRDTGAMHTRLARYVRGRAGVISHVIGPQPLPEDAAQGQKRMETSYVVSFPMSALWPEAGDSRDSLNIDMWDSYLEPA